MASRSPTAFTPLPKSSVAPETPGVVKETMPSQPVPFPPPQTFDIIPPLHGLLLRLLSPQATTDGVSNGARAPEDTAGATGPSGPSTAAQSQSQQHHQSSANGNDNNHGGLPTVSSSVPGSASVAAEIAALSSSAPPPLDIKDLPTEASSIKIRVQKARAVVEALPDVHRSVDEQEQEIEELEDRIARLKSVISDFGRRANAENSRKPKIQAS